MRYTCVDTAEYLYPDITDYVSGTKEIRILSTVAVAEQQKQLDDLSRDLREIDTELQRMNWTADLIEN